MTLSSTALSEKKGDGAAIENPSDLENEERALFAEYLMDKRVFIVDRSSASRTRLAKTMVELGASITKISMIGDYETALAEMKVLKPEVILADYHLGPFYGLDLLQAQRELVPDAHKTFFVLVTGNTSQSAVARAAEEDVDTFILKPYTQAAFERTLVKAGVAKIFPSTYVRTVGAGKELLAKKQLDTAARKFGAALELDPKPTLACFYLGQVESFRLALDQARNCYEKGLQYDKIHYKCLVGLYELFTEQNNERDAYQVLKRIMRYFPANPKRIAAVLRLAVRTESFADIESYYDSFKALEVREENAIRHMCAALVVSGKWYLGRGQVEKAVQIFTFAAISAAGRTVFLRQIIESLVRAGQAAEASPFLDRFPPETHKELDYLGCRYLVEDPALEAGVSIQQGRDLISGGIESPAIYRTLIRRAREAKLFDHAEDLAHKASGRWPQLRAEFEAEEAASC